MATMPFGYIKGFREVFFTQQFKNSCKVLAGDAESNDNNKILLGALKLLFKHLKFSLIQDLKFYEGTGKDEESLKPSLKNFIEIWLEI